MTTPAESQENLDNAIRTALEPGAAEAPLRGAIEELPDVDSKRGDVAEQIKVILDPDGGDVVQTTSLKLPNLRFKLGQFLLEALGAGLSISGTLGEPLATALTAIRFLRNTQNLASVEIGRKDAELLLAVYRLTREEEVITVDDLIPVLVPGHMAEDDLARALERLERLGCIGLGMGEVQLNESIVIKRKG
jgi:hypothetical protein